jgi:oxygen-independent coproporphyrinogen III oxidase
MSREIPPPACLEDRPTVAAYIEEQSAQRQGNKVLHGYPPPLLWREREVPVAEAVALYRDAGEPAAKRLNLYVATPYCLPTEPDRCGFCLFPSEIYRNRDQLDRYLGYLELEGRLYREALGGATLAAVYFGGGTANLYLPDQYQRLLDAVRTVFGPLAAGVEVTLEGIPQLFTFDKLSAMRDAGVNRVSLGVQQLADDLIALSGRRQTAAQVFRTIDDCHRLDLPCSVDLIFGWPRQTLERMLADLEAITAAGVGHLTHYELNVAGRTPFAEERRHELPSRAENLEMYRVGSDFLRQAGYRQQTAYDWDRIDAPLPTDYRFESGWHQPLRRDEAGRLAGLDMWGWGFAGVTSFLGSPRTPGWTYLNHRRVEDYFRDLDAGQFPVERGFRFDEGTLRLNALFQMLHGMDVDREGYRRLFGLDPLEEHAAVWQALTARGWLEIGKERMSLIGDGVFHTPLVQSLLAKPRGFFGVN